MSGVFLNMSGFVRRNWLVIVAILVVLSPALLDIEQLDAVTGGFRNTRDAILGLIGIFVTARFVDTWSKKRAQARDKERFIGLSTIAFRALSQSVNDIGRMLLAPLIGADLHSAGLPGFSKADHDADLATLRLLNVTPQEKQSSGFWDSIDHEKLHHDFQVLCTHREFVQQMFRVTSNARRRLQESMADWAPVMVTVPEANEQLNPGWKLADALVVLAERWRELETRLERGAIAHDVDAIGNVWAAYEETISQYRTWLDALQVPAKLPTKGFALTA
jgi:hypothetical protein